MQATAAVVSSVFDGVNVNLGNSFVGCKKRKPPSDKSGFPKLLEKEVQDLRNKGRPSIAKRQKERARQEKQRQKSERRSLRKEERIKPSMANGEDPDIAGIVPGPQPLPWDDNFEEVEVEGEEEEEEEQT